MLKGQLSRWLLPFNADTSVDEQQAATPRRFQESLQASSAAFAAGDGILTEEEAEYLTAGARKVRQLVRKCTLLVYKHKNSIAVEDLAQQDICIAVNSCALVSGRWNRVTYIRTLIDCRVSSSDACAIYQVYIYSISLYPMG